VKHGIKDIPACVRQTNDQQLLEELAFLENLPVDLNAIEEISLNKMMERLGLYMRRSGPEKMGKEKYRNKLYFKTPKLRQIYNLL